MLNYIVRRLLLFIPTLIVVSFVVYFLIQLPPGDYVDHMMLQLEESGEVVDQAMIDAMNKRYGLDQPFFIQYWRWISNIVKEGDFGRSFQWNRPVSELIWERLSWTMAISGFSLLFTWLVAFPIGIYSATNQYSIGDYSFTILGFLGLATPNFMLALILMWAGYALFGWNMGGLYSPKYQDVAMNFEKFIDLLKHLVVPVIVLGTSGTANLIRVMRANTLDEINKPYVEAARAKGLKEGKIIWKYPVRVALNPFVSGIGNVLPQLVSGGTIVAVVLSLPTAGPMMLRALQFQDMYLAGAFLLMLSVLTLVGTLISDILLAWLDPRIRYN